MAGRNPVRFLAPIALLAFAFALYSVVQDARGLKDPSSASEQQPAGLKTASPDAKATPTATSSGKTQRKTYVVKSGDTPSGIAEKAGLSLTELNVLNPRLKSRSLVPGQKLRLAK